MTSPSDRNRDVWCEMALNTLSFQPLAAGEDLKMLWDIAQNAPKRTQRLRALQLLQSNKIAFARMLQADSLSRDLGPASVNLLAVLLGEPGALGALQEAQVAMVPGPVPGEAIGLGDRGGEGTEGLGGGEVITLPPNTTLADMLRSDAGHQTPPPENAPQEPKKIV